MANSIAYAKQYVNSQVEHLNMFNRYLLTKDLIARNFVVNGKTIAYDVYSFANNNMGNFSRSSGLSAKDFTLTRVEKTLSQDRGDSLVLDIMDKVEGQVADGIVGVYNYYQTKVEIPTLDTYAFAQFGSSTGGATFQYADSGTFANDYDKVVYTISTLKNKRVKTEECVFYGSVSFLGKLRKIALTKALFQMGTWNGEIDTQVELLDKMKVVEVPDSILGENIEYMVIHPMSATVIDVLAMAEYHDRIPGKPGIAQLDVRDHFDAWLEPSGLDGIVVCKSTNTPS